jgi:sporulation protein YlmC with PRC-barrel domain
MMKKTALVLVLVLLLFGGSLASAQQQAGQGQDAGKFQWARKSSDILDKKIESQDGKEIGTVEDLVIGPDGKIEYLILGAGGFAGIGTDKFSVPWDKVRAGDKVDTLVADLPQDKLQKFTEGDRRADQASGRRQQASAQIQRWKDKKVIGRNGEEIGTVKNIYSDQNNQSQFLIVQAQNGKLHAVPADMIRLDQGDQNRLQAQFDRQTFENAPEFQDQEQAQGGQWQQGVRGYYDAAGRSAQQQGGQQQ